MLAEGRRLGKGQPPIIVTYQASSLTISSSHCVARFDFQIMYPGDQSLRHWERRTHQSLYIEESFFRVDCCRSLRCFGSLNLQWKVSAGWDKWTLSVAYCFSLSFLYGWDNQCYDGWGGLNDDRTATQLTKIRANSGDELEHAALCAC